MPTIISSPSCIVSAAYTPIIWRVREYTVSGVLPPAMRVKFYMDGAATVVHDMVLTHVESSQAPPTYYFEVNAQEIVASAIANIETLLPDGVPYLALPIHSVYVTITPLLDTGTGYLTEDPAQMITSSTALVANAYRFSNEGVCMDAYATPVARDGEPPRQWLTRRPMFAQICAELPFYLSGLTQGDISLFVRVFNEEGILLDEDEWIPTEQENDIVLLDVSPAGIMALTPGDWAAGGVTVSADTHRYTVQTLSKGDVVHKVFTLYPVRGCCDYQLVFLNSFGVYECFDIGNDELLTYNVDGQVYTSARLLPSEAGYLLSRGTEYTFKQGRNSMQFTFPQSRDGYHDFYREITISSDVFLRINGELVPVTVNTGTFNLRSNFSFVVTLTWSNADRSHGS